VLPGPTFVSAFLRTYATYLKVDSDPLLDEYRRHHEPRREEPTILHAEPTKGSRSRGAAQGRRRRTRRLQRGYVFVGLLAIVAIALLAWWGTGFGRQNAATLDPNSIPSETTTESVLGGGSTTTTSGTKASSTTSSAVVTGGNITVVLTVTTGSCWMVVREDSKDGPELYAGTLSQGGRKTFDSSKRYYMNVGAPEALAMTVNDKTVALPTSAGEFLVTEAGIQTSQ
jgi:cytoskeletal protein RodZ